MDDTLSEEYLNDNAKLEAKVLRALARLQRKTRNLGKLGKKAGISVKQIVKFLKANYCGLDGDIETQVITALHQSIKVGLVCALDNGRFILLGPKTKTMINACFSRTVHGARCICANKVTQPKACCIVKVNIKKESVSRRRQTKKKKPNSDPSDAESQCENVDATLCDRCFEVHPMMNKALNKNCALPTQNPFTAPEDTFSPRDENIYGKAPSTVKKKK